MSDTDIDWRCAACSISYSQTATSTLDLRLKQPKTVELPFELGSPLDQPSLSVPLQSQLAPQVDFSSVRTPNHLNSALLSHFPKAAKPHSLALDLGCGSTRHRQVCEHAGFEYVGIDFQNPEAMLFGDAHALPFKNDSFDFILSIAVLEHIQYPFVAMREAYRVLKPGGRFIGTVAFLEPFHSHSFYHHTCLGLQNSLLYGGFVVEQIAPSTRWTMLEACSKALFPKLPRWLQKGLMLPLKACHRLWWAGLGMKGTTYQSERRAKQLTGAIAFVAGKGSPR